MYKQLITRTLFLNTNSCTSFVHLPQKHKAISGIEHCPAILNFIRVQVIYSPTDCFHRLKTVQRLSINPEFPQNTGYYLTYKLVCTNCSMESLGEANRRHLMSVPISSQVRVTVTLSQHLADILATILPMIGQYCSWLTPWNNLGHWKPEDSIMAQIQQQHSKLNPQSVFIPGNSVSSAGQSNPKSISYLPFFYTLRINVSMA